MDFFDSEKESRVKAREMVKLFTISHGVSEQDLSLPPLAIVTFGRRMLNGLVHMARGSRIEAWHGRNPSLFLAKVGKRRVVLTRSPYGAPGAVILLEELIAFGVRQIVFVGYCGSIRDEVGLGEIVLPTAAVREEGTSYHYLPMGEACRPDMTLLDSLHQWLQQRGMRVRAGPVWTTDALYRETDRKIERYRGQGVLAVDMEISALFAVGVVRKVGVVAMLLVSDHFSRSHWTPGFFDPLVLEKERVINGVVLDWTADQKPLDDEELPGVVDLTGNAR